MRLGRGGGRSIPAGIRADAAVPAQLRDTRSVVPLVGSHAVVPVEPPDVLGRRLARLAERTLGVA